MDDLKISICIPQYNRIGFLLKNLEYIANQTYTNVEVVVSDDCSTDETEMEIKKLQAGYKFPLIYKRNATNLGYDRNLRQSIELGTGDYCFVLGNDDTLHNDTDLQFLADFLQQNNLPDLGYCNYVEDADRSKVFERALQTAVLGNGYQLALQQFSNFTFVAGLIYKKKSFLQYNTDKFDGSIFTQIYLGCVMISAGCNLFSIKEPLVIKDIEAGNEHRNSYKDTIAKKWKDYKVVDGGLPSVINVIIAAFSHAGVLSQPILYKIFARIYGSSFPHWLLEYRSNQALPEAVGLMRGLYPLKNPHFTRLSYVNRIRLFGRYLTSSFIGLVTPVIVFKKLKGVMYNLVKK